MQKITTLIFLFFFISVNSQNSADKIIITKNFYSARYSSTDTLFKSENITITDKKIISKILKELTVDNKYNLLSKFELDTIYIKNSPEELLKLYSNELEIDWNLKQKEFIFKELSNLKNYKFELYEYLDSGCCYTMHNFYKNEYIIDFYEKSELVNQIKSRKYVWGYKFPWRNKDENLFFNYELDKVIEKLFFEKSKNKSPIKGKVLLKYIVNKIIENNYQELYKLSSYTYHKEIDELKNDFNVISSEEIYGYGRYVALEKNKIIKTTLHNSKMPPNINLQFLATVNEKIYTKDSLLVNYEKVINKVQNINFINDYLVKNVDSKIDIYFFNDKPINSYIVQRVNKNPSEWKKHDEYIESLKWYEKNNIKPSFDLNESIKVSEKLHCGCNYRFEKNFIEKGIFFELFDEFGAASLWVLLPNNNIVVYWISGDELLNYNYSEIKSKNENPCIMFNQNGTIIDKI